MTEAPLKDCPECEGHVQRVIQPVGIVFKGSGFYVTDNRSKSSTALPGKKESDSDTKKTESSKPSETKSKDKPAESKATSKTD
jgi:predicted nucleic acid-binding Zn ribbon protein